LIAGTVFAISPLRISHFLVDAWYDALDEMDDVHIALTRQGAKTGGDDQRLGSVCGLRGWHDLLPAAEFDARLKELNRRLSLKVDLDPAEPCSSRAQLVQRQAMEGPGGSNPAPRVRQRGWPVNPAYPPGPGRRLAAPPPFPARAPRRRRAAPARSPTGGSTARTHPPACTSPRPAC